MNSKMEIEELKELIPDFITGDISEVNKVRVESALSSSEEFMKFYNEMKNTLDFVQNVNPDEPPTVYWSSLLPRIHQRIEEKKTHGFSLEKVLSYWKVFTPIAAVILIAVIYLAVKQPEHDITKEDKKKENIQKDSSLKESKKQEFRKEDKAPEIEDKNNVTGNDDIYSPKVIHKERIVKTPLNEENNELVKEDNQFKQNDNNSNTNSQNSENIAAIDIDDVSILATGEGAGLDEETEDELKKLNDNEKVNLLEELVNSNL